MPSRKQEQARDPNAPIPQDEVIAQEREELRDLNERLRGMVTPNVGRVPNAREGGSGDTTAAGGTAT